MNWKKVIGKIQDHPYFPRYSGWIFLLLFVLFSMIYNYQEILFKPTQSVHQWRQCDCLSITLNYYQDGNAFAEPAVHNLGGDGTGKTMSEFPLLYFSMAKLWKIFGPHEYLYRITVMLFFFAGIFLLFKLFENVLKDSVIAILAALFMFTSPTLVYYGNNFLMDIPALSLAMAGLYLFFKFEESGNNRFLYASATVYALAGLLKISSLLSFAAILGLLVLEWSGVKLYPERKVFRHPFRQALVMLGVVAVQVAWYFYAHAYNSRYNSGNFLIGILPVWNMSEEEIRTTLLAIGDHIRWDYFRRETQIAWLLMFIFVVGFFRRSGRVTYFLTLLCAFGFLAFILLFFLPLKEHDYYTINLFILVPLVLLSFFTLMKTRFGKIYHSWIFRLLILAFLIHNVDFARRRMADRYHPGKWYNSYYVNYNKTFTEIGPYLDSLGITREKKLISLPDPSINISLYLMNRKGWTYYGTEADSTRIRQRITMGAEYLLISDPKAYEFPGVQPFLHSPAGKFNNIDIYRL